MMTTPKLIAICWGYAQEAFWALISFVVTLLVAGPTAVAGYTKETADEWNDVTGLLFSVAVAIWLAYVNLKSSRFGDYLRKTGDERVYDGAFIFPMLVFGLTTITLISCRAVKGMPVPLIAFALLLYSGLNAWNLVKNASGLVRLNGKFRTMMDQTLREMRQRETVDDGV